MIINRAHEKVVLYEIMDEDEILYFKNNKKNSPNFISIDKQLQRGIDAGYF